MTLKILKETLKMIFSLERDKMYIENILLNMKASIKKGKKQEKDCLSIKMEILMKEVF